jgi:PAS domain S-box-containing protein
MHNPHKLPLKITAAYTISSGAWILLSDKIAYLMAPDAETLASWSTFKGLFFILLTAGFLIWIVCHYRKVLGRSQKIIDRQERGLFTSRIRLLNLRGRISDSKRLLAVSERKYRALFENAGDAVLLFNGDAITDCNPMAEKIFALSRENILRKKSGELSPELQPDGGNSKTMLREKHEAALLNTDQRFEWILQKSDGSLFDAEIKMSRIEIDNMMMVQAFIRDTTENKRKEEALRESERRFRETLENIRLLAVGLDVHGDISFCNDYLLGLTGWRREEVIGQNWFNLFCPADSRDADIFQKSIRCGSIPLHFKNDILTRQGERRLISWNNTLLRDPSGRIIGLNSIGEDISERRQLEAQLRHAQKMEAVGSLAGGVAHEFNNILTAIIGYAGLIEMRMASDDPSVHSLTQIHSAVDRATNLTNGLLAYGKNQLISPHPVDLNVITKNITRLLTPIIGEDIEVNTSFSRESLLSNADPSQIDNVLMTLVTNSRDSMPGGGVLTITTAKAELGNEFFKIHGYGEPGCYALLTVSDNGSGMSEATRLRIFEPFFTTKEVGKGTGLGLSVAYGIVRQHNGFINVLSSPDAGTSVQIYLPLISRTAEKPKNADLAFARGNETVIIAEDDAGVRKLTKKVLTQFGYTVFEAVDGEDAVRVFTENSTSVELVIFDLILPKKSAKIAYSEMKMIKPDLKALFTSGYTADVIRKKGVLDEGLPYLAKPIVPTELLTRVRDIFEHGG